ncbi:MAG: tyrosine-type recombinase/integrase [Acidobacteria bacterium]|nr:tyrosine-type recombinase/integrase [Acidobacteriota bacterium]
MSGARQIPAHPGRAHGRDQACLCRRLPSRDAYRRAACVKTQLGGSARRSHLRQRPRDKESHPKTAPIYGDMKPWLEMLLSRGQIESPKCVWLFSRNGQPVKDFKADWKQACEKAGVPELLFHDLRRTAVRNMIRAGVPEKIAMLISGHKTASMLWRYNITDARDIKDAGKRTERYLEAQRGQEHAHLPTQ